MFPAHFLDIYVKFYYQPSLNCSIYAQQQLYPQSEGEMNLEEYFKRIGFHGLYDKPDLATLKLIHKQHVMSVPFENLSIHCGERITMDLDLIFNKIVRSSRGGWCLENNFLFGWVLREMGYDTTTLGSRVFNSTSNEFCPGETHLVNKVVIDGKAYVADVSFGVSSQVWEPLELVSGKDQPQAAGVFRLIDEGDMWVLEKTGRRAEVLNPDFAKSSLVDRKETKKIYGFTLVPRKADHFFETNHKLQTDPTSLFTNKSICSLQTPTGFRALVGWTYSEVIYKPEQGVDVLDMRDVTDDEIELILREKFNVKLQNKLQSVNKTACYTI
ncbi:arylamine N-acetyltransferase, pineal gland isozyme NAT-10-like [Micropterus salmoides]|uniref:arylamine N-acetyltransferase, pineal gland isozyme NAT-10-like n=1 Tax=Micropterus salmoides TaxID=27706 RepID=UPI0018ECAB98|nr:arylamine N-acetyltransferase, pineal gland isozyme NAT-10-like [Micropterus salmoides]